MAHVTTHGAGGREKLMEVLGRKRSGGRSAGRDEEDAPRMSRLLRGAGASGRAERYSSMADDAALSEAKREAAMLFSAAESHLEAGEAAECRKVADSALAKFSALGTSGQEGYLDTLHVIVDSHRLEAYLDYDSPEEAERVATEFLEEFTADGNKRGEAVMKLALAEIGTDNVRLEKRRDALGPAMDALALARDLGDKRLEAKCWVEAAFVYFSMGDPAKMLEAADAASSISEELGDTLGRAMALYATGLSHVRRHDWDSAVQAAGVAQRLLERAGRPCLEAGVLHTMAIWRLLEGKPKKAVPLAQQALERARQIDRGRWPEAVVALTLVEALAEDGSAKPALKAATEALNRLEAKAGPHEQAVAHEALAVAHLAADAPSKAAAALELATGLAGQVEAKRYQSRLLLAEAAVHQRLRHRAAAAETLERAIDLARSVSDLHQVARAQRELCALQLLDGAEGLSDASDSASAAAATARLDGDKVAEAGARLQEALIHALREEHSQAVSACADAEELYRDVGSQEGEAQAMWLTAEVRAADEKFDEAITAARERLTIAQQLEDSRLQVRAGELLARLLTRGGKHEEGERRAEEALLLAQDLDDKRLELDTQLLLVQLHLMRSVQGARDTSAKGQIAAAAKRAGEAVQSATSLGEKGPRGVALYWKAQTLISEGRYQEAQRTNSEAEALFKNIQSDQGQGACLHLAGALHAVFGQADRAMDTLDRALAFAQVAKDASLEYEVSTSIYNVQRQLQPQQMQQQQQAIAAQAMDADGAAEAAGAPSMVVAAQPKGLDPSFVRKQLMNFVREVVATDDELELDSPFMDAGLDSLSSVALMSMVAKEFQMALSPSLVFDFPTVRALEDHLVEESKLG